MTFSSQFFDPLKNNSVHQNKNKEKNKENYLVREIELLKLKLIKNKRNHLNEKLMENMIDAKMKLLE